MLPGDWSLAEGGFFGGVVGVAHRGMRFSDIPTCRVDNEYLRSYRIEQCIIMLLLLFLVHADMIPSKKRRIENSVTLVQNPGRHDNTSVAPDTPMLSVGVAYMRAEVREPSCTPSCQTHLAESRKRPLDYTPTVTDELYPAVGDRHRRAQSNHDEQREPSGVRKKKRTSEVEGSTPTSMSDGSETELPGTPVPTPANTTSRIKQGWDPSWREYSTSLDSGVKAGSASYWS